MGETILSAREGRVGHPSRSQCHGERLQPSQDYVRYPLDSLLRLPHPWKLLEQLLNCDLTLQSCQLIPNAEVRTSAEREMRITHALQIQPVWLSKLCGVSIRSPQHKKDQLACAQP